MDIANPRAVHCQNVGAVVSQRVSSPPPPPGGGGGVRTRAMGSGFSQFYLLFRGGVGVRAKGRGRGRNLLVLKGLSSGIFSIFYIALQGQLSYPCGKRSFWDNPSHGG